MSMRTAMGLLAVCFFLVNLGGAAYAFIVGELAHAGLHAVLLAPGAWALWRLAPRRVPGY
jgi:hypothetical protein